MKVGIPSNKISLTPESYMRRRKKGSIAFVDFYNDTCAIASVWKSLCLYNVGFIWHTIGGNFNTFVNAEGSSMGTVSGEYIMRK